VQKLAMDPLANLSTHYIQQYPVATIVQCFALRSELAQGTRPIEISN